MDQPLAQVLIVDDHPLYLDGVTALLRDLFGPVNILQAATGRDALAIADARSDLDWIFLDYTLPDCTGLTLLRTLREKMITAPVVMVSGADQVALVTEALDLGASGFIAKTGARDDYRQCLAVIEAGGTYLPAGVAQAVAHYRATVQAERNRILKQISQRQNDVLLLIAAGYSNGEIATALGISEHTVKAHVSTLMQLLNADNRVHCIAEARELGLIS